MSETKKYFIDTQAIRDNAIDIKKINGLEIGDDGNLYVGEIDDTNMIVVKSILSSYFKYISENTSLKRVNISAPVYGSAFYESSDERLKIFTNPIEIDLDKLAKLRKSYFTYIEAPGTTQIGVSAQEIKEIYPEIVSENCNGYLTVDYSKLSVVALKAVDELHNKNKELEERLNRLEKLISEK